MGEDCVFSGGCVFADAEYNDDDETVTLCWDTTFPLGKAVLSMMFYGQLNDKLKVRLFFGRVGGNSRVNLAAEI